MKCSFFISSDHKSIELNCALHAFIAVDNNKYIYTINILIYTVLVYICIVYNGK